MGGSEEEKSHGYTMGSDGCQFYSQHGGYKRGSSKSLRGLELLKATNAKAGSDAEGASK